MKSKDENLIYYLLLFLNKHRKNIRYYNMKIGMQFYELGLILHTLKIF